MRNLLVVTILLATIFGCSKTSEPVKKQTDLIIGNWKLVATQPPGVIGVIAQWSEVTNGYTLNLNDNNTYLSSQYLPTICSSGSFSFDSSFLTLTNTCGSMIPLSKYNIVSKSTNEIIISNAACFEGCPEKFKRIGSE